MNLPRRPALAPPPVVAKAYAVVWEHAGQIVDAGIYSEPTPTSTGAGRPRCIEQAKGNSFGDARVEVLAKVAAHPDWILAVLAGRCHEVAPRGRRLVR